MKELVGQDQYERDYGEVNNKIAVSLNGKYNILNHPCQDTKAANLIGPESKMALEAYGRAIASQNYRDETIRQTIQELSDIKYALEQAAIVAITDEKGIIRYVNDKFCEVSKYSREELLGKNHRIVNSGYHPPEFFEEFWSRITTGEVWQGEIKNQAKDGTYYWVETTVVPFVNEKEKPYKYLAIRFDITARKQAEEALRCSEAKNRSLVNAIPDLMFRLNKEGIFRDYYPAKNDKNAPTASAVIGKSISEVFPTDLAYLTRHFLEQTLQTRQPQCSEYVLPIDGSWRHCEARYVPCGEDEVLAIVRDITDRKQVLAALRLSEARERDRALQLEQALLKLQQTQAQLIQAEKMSSLGQMVAGIAHEINNPVSFIYGNLSHMDEYIENLLQLLDLYQQHDRGTVPEISAAIADMDLDFVKEDLPQLISSMNMGANRIREIILSLRNFSRLDEAQMKAVNIHEGIDSTLLILQNRLKTKPGKPEITVVKNYGDLPLVECHACGLNQVFMNMIANAIDALDKQPPPRSIFIKTAKNIMGDRIVISIADNGPGIPPEVQKRLFDPFFTTKPVGKGTGLGLSISHNIVVEKHSGTLQCISHPGEGTEFLIEIPLRAAQVGTAHPTPETTPDRDMAATRA
ncbi:MAG: PAS domain S-box protein [Hormoscilla sp.]